MKKQYLSKIALAALAFTFCVHTADAQLGNLKNKVKSAAGNVGGNNSGNSSSSSSSTTTNDNSSNTGTTSSTPLSNVTNAGSPGWYKVSAPTCVFSSDYGFGTTKTDFQPGENIFVRFAFPKSVGETFMTELGLSNIPGTAKLSLVVAKNAEDENPVVIYSADIMTSRYTKDNVIDFSLQADQKTIETIANGTGDVAQKVCFNSQGTMGNTALNDEWFRQAALFPISVKDWEVFVAISPWNNTDPAKVKLVTLSQNKFKYTVTAENKSKLAAGMNMYDKQRFEKTPDDGVVTGVHKNNVEKIIFAKNKMTKDFDDASALKTSFDNLSGGLYARLYLKESMRNIFANDGNGKDVSDVDYRIDFYVDGNKEMSCWSIDRLMQEDALKRTSWAIALAPNQKEDEDMNPKMTERFAYVISELKPGKHKIKMIAKYGGVVETQKVIAEGEFEINIAAAERDAFAVKYGAHLPQKGALEDAALEAQVKKLCDPSVKNVRCPKVWENRTNAFGSITHRVTIVHTGYIDKTGRSKQGSFMIEQVKMSNGWDKAQYSTRESMWYGVEEYLPLQNNK
ncbi:MAG: hypothetical protein K0S33_1982 [Bacteroidetes bacterium]|jgi:hypothetical protein|nr:hypothetical protein [Bacteroidota bacterium]